MCVPRFARANYLPGRRFGVGSGPQRVRGLRRCHCGGAGAKRGGMFCVGIVRIGTPDDLRNAGADVVVDDLDKVSYRALAENV